MIARRAQLSLATTLLFASLWAPAHAGSEDGMYLRVEYGVSDTGTDEGTVRNNDGSGTMINRFDIPYDNGSFYGGALGYSFGATRLELEFRRLDNDIPEPAAGELGSEFIKLGTRMLNLWFDFNRSSNIRPYVGAGVGFADIKVRGGSADDVAGQLGAGIQLRLSDRWAMSTNYRFLSLAKMDYTDDLDNDESVTWDGHLLSLGVRYNIDGCRDRDGDGICDREDACPDSPPDATLDSRGCQRDSDGDGVVDDEDRCPNTPSGTEVDSRGCARITDSDDDGVIDRKDECPGTPRGTEVMSNGCAAEQSVVLEGVNFEFDSARLTLNAEGILDQMAQVLKSSPGFRVELQGHTDGRGSDRYNLRLSQQRADSVKAYLVSRGIDEDRLEARGYGETEPVASNDTEAGRAKNRRVEAKVIEKN